MLRTRYATHTCVVVCYATHTCVRYASVVCYATHPLCNATHPLCNATHPLRNATHPLCNATHPLCNATHPLCYATHPTSYAPHRDIVSRELDLEVRQGLGRLLEEQFEVDFGDGEDDAARGRHHRRCACRVADEGDLAEVLPCRGTRRER